MTFFSFPRRSLLLAGTLSTLLVATWPVAAQQPAPLPPGSPLIGRPDTDDAKKLAPVAPPPLAAAADKLPVDKLKAPKGFKIEVYASGMTNARSLALGDKGTVFVGSRLLDKVYAIVDKDGKREPKVIASGLDRPNGVAFKNGTLYIAEGSQISKIEGIEDKLDNPPKPTARPGARLEVSRHRARQQALFRCRTALQQLHPERQARAIAPDQSRRQRHRGGRARRSSLGRLRLAPGVEGNVLHR